MIRYDVVSDGRWPPAWSVSGLSEAMKLDVMSGPGRCFLTIETQFWEKMNILLQVGLLSRDGWAINSDPFCGGTLVNSRHIVTAAHCTHGKTAAQIAVTVILSSVSELFIFCSDRGPQHHSNCNGA